MASPPKHTGLAAVNGAHLAYEVRGSGHPLVLIHAGIADSRMWDDQMDAFAAHYRVIRYDLRGFGQSDVPTEPFSRADDLYGLLSFLGVERAYLVGASMGGATAIDFTLQRPEMVDALITVGSGLGGYAFSDDLVARWSAIDAAHKAGDLAWVVELELRIWVDGVGRTPDAVNPGVRERVREMNAHAISRDAEAFEPIPLEPSAAARLAYIHTPTLVLVGDRDVADIQTIAGLLAAGIPGARKKVLPDTAHVPNMEQPDRFNQLVLDFLSGL